MPFCIPSFLLLSAKKLIGEPLGILGAVSDNDPLAGSAQLLVAELGTQPRSLLVIVELAPVRGEKQVDDRIGAVHRYGPWKVLRAEHRA